MPNALKHYTPITEAAHSNYPPGVPFEIPQPDASIFGLLQHTAAAYPKAIAIDYFGATWTYAEVLDESLRAARALLDAGVRKGDVVAFAMPNCPQHLIAFYGAMRIGAIVAEHNPLAPAAQIAQQIRRHRGAVAIVWDKIAEKFVDAGLHHERIHTVNLVRSMPAKMKAQLKLPVQKARESLERLEGPAPEGCPSWDDAVAQAAPIPSGEGDPQVGPVMFDGDPTAAYTRRRRLSLARDLVVATARSGAANVTGRIAGLLGAGSNDVPGATGSDVAVILHSSGTNGVPKSVPLTHANIRANVNQNLFWVFELDRGSEVFFSLLPYFHAFGLTFFLCCGVAIGATQIMLPAFDVDLALDAHKRRNVTFFVGVPPMFARIAAGAIKRKIDITSIKYSISGGMALSEDISRLWEATTRHFIIEGYGMSETSPTVCGSPLSPERRHECLGLPFPSTEVRIVKMDDPNIDVAEGETGELLVRGPQVFAGYLDAPEENEKAFVDGWLRTGDICRSQDGFIYLVDRVKDVIICSGFNVFPSQVEQAIREVAPGIEDCVVVGLPDLVRGETVVAVLAGDAEAATEITDDGEDGEMVVTALTVELLRERLTEKLPRYAIPREVVFVPEIPHSLIGKPERKKMRDILLAERGMAGK